MANIHSTLASLFTDIANAIRAKTGQSGTIVADNFPSAISEISTGTDTSDATAAAADMLSGKTAYGADGKITGSMPNRGAVSQALNAGQSYTIPAGYHNGNGKIEANSLASQTSATATASDIASGKTAWVNGVRLNGTGQMVGDVVTIEEVVDHGNKRSRHMCLATSFGTYDFQNSGVNVVNFPCRVGEPVVLIADSSFEAINNYPFIVTDYADLDYYSVAVYICQPGEDYYYISFET